MNLFRFAHLAALALRLGAPSSTAFGAAWDVVHVTDDPVEQDWAIVWCWHEGNLDPRSVSKDGYTHGTCHVAPSVWGDVPESRREQIANGLEVVRYLREECGSLRSALVAYSVGTCRGAEPEFVAYRCRFFDCEAWSFRKTISLP